MSAAASLGRTAQIAKDQGGAPEAQSQTERERGAQITAEKRTLFGFQDDRKNVGRRGDVHSYIQL